MEEYDEEQVRLMEERCILVNEKDEAYGEDSKKTCTFLFSFSGKRYLIAQATSCLISTTGCYTEHSRCFYSGRRTGDCCCSNERPIKSRSPICGQTLAARIP
jgi:hypothetical protein